MDYQIKWLWSMNLCLRLTHMIDRLFRVCYLGSINSSVSRRFSFPGAKSWSTMRNSAKRHLTKTNRKPVKTVFWALSSHVLAEDGIHIDLGSTLNYGMGQNSTYHRSLFRNYNHFGQIFIFCSHLGPI